MINYYIVAQGEVYTLDGAAEDEDGITLPTGAHFPRLTYGYDWMATDAKNEDVALAKAMIHDAIGLSPEYQMFALLYRRGDASLLTESNESAQYQK